MSGGGGGGTLKKASIGVPHQHIDHFCMIPKEL